jgi:hypothetical protein
LTSKTERGEFGVGDDSSCLLGSVDHWDHQTAILSAGIFTCTASTYCAPVSSARLRRSGAGPRTRMIGETPNDEMAETLLCIESSLICPFSQLVAFWGKWGDSPCSQSIITPSSPVKAIIWACRTDGMATKVIKGFSSLLSLFSNLRRGFWTEVVCAVGVEVGWIVMLNSDGVFR